MAVGRVIKLLIRTWFLAVLISTSVATEKSALKIPLVRILPETTPVSATPVFKESFALTLMSVRYLAFVIRMPLARTAMGVSNASAPKVFTVMGKLVRKVSATIDHVLPIKSVFHLQAMSVNAQKG